MPQVAISGPDGKILVEAEELQRDGAKPVGRGVSNQFAQEDVAKQFSGVIGFVRKAAGEHAPTSLEVELSLAITTEGNFLIVKGDASASLKLKAKWET